LNRFGIEIRDLLSGSNAMLLSFQERWEAWIPKLKL